MNEATVNILCKQFDMKRESIEFVNKYSKEVKDRFFSEIDDIKEYNQYKVIGAMQKAGLNSNHFGWTTGYGYDDMGREKTEEVYAEIFNTEDALVRPTIVSGTHAITLSLSALLKPGDELIYITGTPYDTLTKVIGLEEHTEGSLIDYGVKYNEVPLLDTNDIDIDKVVEAMTEETKVVAIQRSTGYSDRIALTVAQIGRAIEKIREVNKDVIIFIDNCYGEFVERLEPSDVGADIMAGSLIKNPGGGLALTGGYVVGHENLIELVANRSTAPGIGKDCGLTFGMTRTVLQGLFLAPHIVSEALKGALLTAYIYKKLGFRVLPDVEDPRSDIIQGIEFKNKDKMIAFCEGIQSASPIDSQFTPIPSEMPGYDDDVIMAAGAFVQGSSIEMSADGPIREPYFAYYQGGLTYEHCKLGVMQSLDRLYTQDLIDLNKIG